MSHLVYLVTIKRNKLPNKYIGSKTNCRYENGLILYGNEKEYWGSSSDEEYQYIIKNNELDKKIEILEYCDTPLEALERERYYHIQYDVVGDEAYFNKSVAMANSFSFPNYGTFKHIVTGKIKRLPIDHPKVIKGEWVGVTKGIRNEKSIKILNDYNKNNDNAFLGKRHTEESKRKMSRGVRSWLDSMSEEEMNHHKLMLSKTCKNNFKGRKLSKSHINKISEARKNKCSIINMYTQEKIFIDMNDYNKNYDHSIWVTMPKYIFNNRNKYINVETLEEKYLEENPDENIWILTTNYYENKIRGVKICPICNKEFEYKRDKENRATCSNICKRKYMSKKGMTKNKGRKKYKNKSTGEFQYFKEIPDLKEWIWWSDPNRVIKTKKCVVCGCNFDILKKQKYLRDTCTKQCADVYSSQQMVETRYNKNEN